MHVTHGVKAGAATADGTAFFSAAKVLPIVLMRRNYPRRTECCVGILYIDDDDDDTDAKNVRTSTRHCWGRTVPWR
jgi:hypothetical protein